MKMNNCYSIFENDQVLTAEQLNRNFEYIYNQTRISRTKMIGVGIICGYEVKYENNIITVEKGAALTSNGDLFHHDSKIEYTKYKAFNDNNAKYPFFMHGNKQIPLIELFTEKDTTVETQKLSTLTNIKKMVLILYLESYVSDLDECTGSDCDNKGKKQCKNLKALMILEEDFKKLRKNRPTPKQFYSKLKDIDIKRVILIPNRINKYKDFQTVYIKTINETISILIPALMKSYNICRPLLHESDSSNEWKTILTDLKDFSEKGIQYVYDFLEDVVTAYNEFRDVLFELYEDNDTCCLDIQLFNKHVVLGFVMKDNSLKADPFRHGFYGSPLFNNRHRKLEKVRFFFKRIDCLINGFKIPSNDTGIKITPGKCYEKALGLRSIPYYYEVTPSNPINKFWNFDLHLRGKDDSIYSYNADKYSKNQKTLTPLKYSIRDYKYFRIEGCVGMDVDKAIKFLEQQELPLRIIALQVENDKSRVKPKQRINNGELKFMHHMFRNDIMQNLQNLKAYNIDLKNTIQMAKELPQPKITDPAITFKDYVKNYTFKLEGIINIISSNLKMEYKKFNHDSFELQYKDAILHASNLNQSIKGITHSSVFTPYETLVNDSRFRWLKWINIQIKEKEEKAKEHSIFASYPQNNTWMEHIAGIMRGDTFILVYTSNDNKVVADFSVPCCCECIEEETEKKIEDNVLDEGIKWTTINKLKIYLGERYELKADLDKFRTEITTIDDTLKEKSTIIEKNSERIIKIDDNIISRFKNIDVDLKKSIIERFSTYFKDDVSELVKVRIDNIKKDIQAEITNKISVIEKQYRAELKVEVQDVISKLDNNIESIDELEINYRKIDSSLISKIDLITARAETKLTNLVNDKFVNINKVVNEVKADKEKLEDGINGVKDSVNVYKNIVANYIKSPKTVTETGISRTRIFVNPEYEHMATMLDYAKDHNERIIEKQKAGTKLTKTEILMQRKFDDITADVTNRLIAINKERTHDIASGSEDEKILNMALRNMDSISNAAIKVRVKRNANSLASRLKSNPATAGRTVTINTLNRF